MAAFLIYLPYFKKGGASQKRCLYNKQSCEELNSEQWWHRHCQLFGNTTTQPCLFCPGFFVKIITFQATGSRGRISNNRRHSGGQEIYERYLSSCPFLTLIKWRISRKILVKMAWQFPRLLLIVCIWQDRRHGYKHLSESSIFPLAILLQERLWRL